jgi:phosphomevalonate kinase
MQKVKLIGLCSKMGGGKDYIADNFILPLLKNSLKMSFGDQIKINVMTKKKISYDSVYVNKTKETRILLQQEGTEEGRNLVDVYGNSNKNIWIDYLHNWITLLSNRGISSFVISDIRFKNEIQYIKENNGKLIKIIAPIRNEQRLQNESKGDINSYNKIKNHSSECDLDNIPDSEYDLILYNDPDLLTEKQIEKLKQLKQLIQE